MRRRSGLRLSSLSLLWPAFDNRTKQPQFELDIIDLQQALSWILKSGSKESWPFAHPSTLSGVAASAVPPLEDMFDTRRRAVRLPFLLDGLDFGGKPPTRRPARHSSQPKHPGNGPFSGVLLARSHRQVAALDHEKELCVESGASSTRHRHQALRTGWRIARAR
ncbi:hypothetical protein OH77DRAFT_592412 [Trametes cingulata]|nr:hypothetical protein OH77DRAFT_592412 [Trametes cingulata]